MPEGPKKRARIRKEMFGFRAEPELAQWLKSKMNPRVGIGQTEVLSWAVTEAKNYVEATKGLDARIKAHAQAKRLTELEALREIVEAGLGAVEKK